jgi:hypothetical protein
MTLANVMDRVQQLRAHLGLDTAAATSSSANGASFASALSSAQATGDSTVAGTSGTTGSAVIDSARKYLGIKYVYGSNNPDKGLDCSGLVQRAYGDLGIKLPRVAADQAKMGTKVNSLAEAKPGDLVAFGSPVDHIGIYMGDNKMVVAPHTGDVVKIQNVYKTPSAIRRIIPDTAAGGVSASAYASLRPSSLSVSGSVPYADQFKAAAAKYGIDPNLLAGVAKVESNYNPGAVSPAGARGLMQIMPGTARGLGVDPMNPSQAIDGAAKLLSRNLKEFNGDLSLAIAAYNAGGGAVHRYGGIPPFAETQAYVPKVKAAMAALRGKGSW